MRMPHSIAYFPLFIGLLAAHSLQAVARDTAPPLQTPLPGQVLISGTVPDEATKASVLQKAREVYGAEKIVDQISIGSVVLPANWTGHVQKMIGPGLRSVSRGQLQIDGTVITVRGEVPNEALRQQVASDLATGATPSYLIQNRLWVTASEQSVLDQALANRIVEFDSGKASLTAAGKAVLDDMVPALARLSGRSFEVVGHTDNSGLRASNIALSRARADTVRQYFISKGIDGSRIATFGIGPDLPVASNDTVDGRSRNRRIEFRVAR